MIHSVFACVITSQQKSKLSESYCTSRVHGACNTAALQGYKLFCWTSVLFITFSSIQRDCHLVSPTFIFCFYFISFYFDTNKGTRKSNLLGTKFMLSMVFSCTPHVHLNHATTYLWGYNLSRNTWFVHLGVKMPASNIWTNYILFVLFEFHPHWISLHPTTSLLVVELDSILSFHRFGWQYTILSLLWMIDYSV